MRECIRPTLYDHGDGTVSLIFPGRPHEQQTSPMPKAVAMNIMGQVNDLQTAYSAVVANLSFISGHLRVLWERFGTK